MRPMTEFKLALAQMRIEGGEKLRNLGAAEERVAEAAAQGARVVLLPEAMDVGWTFPEARRLAEPIPDGEPARRLARCARLNGVWVCAGLTERAGNRVFNTAVLFSPTGELRCTHRKLNELTIGHPYYDQGDHLSVIATEWGTCGLMVCADAFARDRVLSRSLCYMGADLILSPCAWAVPGDHNNNTSPYGELWHNSYMPVAREFRIWIAAVSNVGWINAGPWAGRKCIGCSMVINPDGQEVLQGPYGDNAEALLYVNINPIPRPARGCGWEESL